LNNILAIDIGSSKIAAIIAGKTQDGITINGVGISASKGIKKGAIVNIDNAAYSIKKAVGDAVRIAGIENLNKAIVSISSCYTKSITSDGVINVPSNEITIKEINRAIQTALYNAVIPSDYQVLQAIPFNFKVDNLSEIDDPAGMSGSRLEVALHIIVAQKSGIENLKKTLKQAGLEIENIVHSGYASGLSTLNPDEKELGVSVIDIGATTSDIAIFINSHLRYTDYLGVGSHHITNDLSSALQTPLREAELIKVNFDELVARGEDLIEIPGRDNENEKQIASINTIAQVISSRIEETFLLLNKKIEDSGLKDKLGAGVVLTGGFTNFYKLKEIARQFFGGMPVRIGRPKKISGVTEDLNSPEFACAIGLVLYGMKEDLNYEIDSNMNFRTKHFEKNLLEKPTREIEFDEPEEEEEEVLPPQIQPQKIGFFTKLKNWISNLF